MKFDQMSDNGQSQPESANLSGAARISLPEAIEHVGQELSTDTLAGVRYTQLNVFVRSFERQFDATAGRRKFYGVREQIPDDLL
jgi:hypothetical protein